MKIKRTLLLNKKEAIYRILARLYDYWFLFGIVYIFLQLIGSLEQSKEKVDFTNLASGISFIISPFYEGYSLASKGTTFGKKAFGIKLIHREQKNISFWTGATRSFIIFLSLVTMKLHFLLIIPFIYSIYTLFQEKAFWDKILNIEVIHSNIDKHELLGQSLIIIILMLISVLIYV